MFSLTTAQKNALLSNSLVERTVWKIYFGTSNRQNRIYDSAFGVAAADSSSWTFSNATISSSGPFGYNYVQMAGNATAEFSQKLCKKNNDFGYDFLTHRLDRIRLGQRYVLSFYYKTILSPGTLSVSISSASAAEDLTWTFGTTSGAWVRKEQAFTMSGTGYASVLPDDVVLSFSQTNGIGHSSQIACVMLHEDVQLDDLSWAEQAMPFITLEPKICYEDDGGVDVTNYVTGFSISSEASVGHDASISLPNGSLTIFDDENIFSPSRFSGDFDPENGEFVGPMRADGLGAFRKGNRVVAYNVYSDTNGVSFSLPIGVFFIESASQSLSNGEISLNLSNYWADLSKSCTSDIISTTISSEDAISTMAFFAGYNVEQPSAETYLSFVGDFKSNGFFLASGESRFLDVINRLAIANNKSVYVDQNSKIIFRDVIGNSTDSSLVVDYDNAVGIDPKTIDSVSYVTVKADPIIFKEAEGNRVDVTRTPGNIDQGLFSSGVPYEYELTGTNVVNSGDIGLNTNPDLDALFDGSTNSSVHPYYTLSNGDSDVSREEANVPYVEIDIGQGAHAVAGLHLWFDSHANENYYFKVTASLDRQKWWYLAGDASKFEQSNPNAFQDSKTVVGGFGMQYIRYVRIYMNGGVGFVYNRLYDIQIFKSSFNSSIIGWAGSGSGTVEVSDQGITIWKNETHTDANVTFRAKARNGHVSIRGVGISSESDPILHIAGTLDSGFKIYDGGVRAYNTLGSPTFDVNTATGDVTIKGTICAGAGCIAGWDITATDLCKANARINSSGYISFGATPPTAYGNNVGSWLGYDSGAKMSLYNNTSNYLQWDGTKLLIKAANFELDASGNLTASNANITGTITATTGAIAGWCVQASCICSTNAVIASGVANTARIEFGTGATAAGINTANAGTDVSFWAGSTHANRATAPFRVTAAGCLFSCCGSIAGWTIGTETISAANATLCCTGVVSLGTSNDVAVLSAADATYRLWIGNSAAASAPFSVTKAGAISATAGSVGGFTISSVDGFYSGTGSTRVQMKPGAGFWAGHDTQTSAPFYVTQAGALCATSGKIAGWTLGAASLSSGNLYLDSTGVLRGNWSAGLSGWCISADGSAEFNNVTARGSFYGSISITSGILEVGCTALDSNAIIRAISNDTHTAGFEAYGNSQGTGYLYVGQNSTFGGGVAYNGDGSPAFATGEFADTIAYYRKNSGTNEVVFYHSYDSNNVQFRGNILSSCCICSAGNLLTACCVVSSGNILTGCCVCASGLIRSAGNICSSSCVVASNNILTSCCVCSAGNLRTALCVVAGGNILTSCCVCATGLIQSAGNVCSSTCIVASNNILTACCVCATGLIQSASNILSSCCVCAAGLLFAGTCVVATNNILTSCCVCSAGLIQSASNILSSCCICATGNIVTGTCIYSTNNILTACCLCATGNIITGACVSASNNILSLSCICSAGNIITNLCLVADYWKPNTATSSYIRICDNKVRIYYDMALYNALTFTTSDITTTGSGGITATCLTITGSTCLKSTTPLHCFSCCILASNNILSSCCICSTGNLVTGACVVATNYICTACCLYAASNATALNYWTATNGNFYLRLPDYVGSGGWARGLLMYSCDGTSLCSGVGMYGACATICNMFIGHGASPWSSGCGIYILKAGNVGIGCTTPNYRLDVAGTGNFCSHLTTATAGSSNFASGLRGWCVSGGISEFNNVVVRGELRSAVFKYDEISAVGGQLMIANAGTLLTCFTTPTLGCCVVICLKETTATPTLRFAVNDVVRVKTFNGTNIYDFWGVVTAYCNRTTYYDYTVRGCSGTVGIVIPDATTIVSYGPVSTGGGILLNGQGTNSPYMDIFLNSATPWTTLNPKVRLGNLAGISGFSGYGLWTDNGYIVGGVVQSNNYGVAAGSCFDLTNGCLIMGGSNAPKFKFDGTNLCISGLITATSGTIGGWDICANAICKLTGCTYLAFGRFMNCTSYNLGLTWGNCCNACWSLVSIGQCLYQAATWCANEGLAVTLNQTEYFAVGKPSAGGAVFARIAGVCFSNTCIYSCNYAAGSAGYALECDGSAEFSNVIARGTICATAGFFCSCVYAAAGCIGGWSISSCGLSQGTCASVGKHSLLRCGCYDSGSNYFYNHGRELDGLSLTWYCSSNAGHIVVGALAATACTFKTGFYGIQMLDYNNHEYFALSANVLSSGSMDVYNRIGGTAFTYQCLYSTNYAAGSCGYALKCDGSAEFSNVTARGTVCATAGFFCSCIYAGAGCIAGWSLTTCKICAGNVGMDSCATSGTVAFYAGCSTPGSAPFRVTNQGCLVATSACVTGMICATSGYFTGTLGAGIICASNMFLRGVGAALNMDPNFVDTSAWTCMDTYETYKCYCLTTVNDGKVGKGTMRSCHGCCSYTMFATSEYIPFDPSKTYRVRLWARAGATCTACAGTLYMSLRHYNCNCTSLDANAGTYLVSCLLRTTTWTEFVVTAAAGSGHADTRYVRLGGILNYVPLAAGTYHEIQDFRLEEAVPATLVVDGAITSDKITSSQIIGKDFRTACDVGVACAVGVMFNSSGIDAYNGSARTFCVNSSSGDIFMAGCLVSKGVFYRETTATRFITGDANCSNFVGDNAGNTSTTGFYNTGVGWQALCAVTSGCRNTSIGYASLYKLSTGNCNTAVGMQSMSAGVVTGTGNTAVGTASLPSLTSGACNSIVGHLAAYSNTTGCANTGIGLCALYANVSGNHNVAIGPNAGLKICNASGNTVIGEYSADICCYSGDYSIAIGYATHRNVTTGGSNVVIGACSLLGAVTGNNNVIIGNCAGCAITSGTCNVGIGMFAVRNITTGFSNVGIGEYAIGNVTTGCCNIGIGTCAGFGNAASGHSNNSIGRLAAVCITSGCYNESIGTHANYCITTGNINVAIGLGAGCYLTTGCYNVAVGGYAGRGDVTLGLTGLGNVSVGYAAESLVNTGCYNTGIGYAALYSVTTGCNNTGVGVDSGRTFSTGSHNTSVGATVFNGPTTGSNNTGVGSRLGLGTLTGSNNVVIGHCSYVAATSGYENIVIGACSVLGIVTGHNNVVIGNCAGCSITSGVYNIGIGILSMASVADGHYNVGIGACALNQTTSGQYNTGVGTRALGLGILVGWHNTAIGYGSGYKTTSGYYNTDIGSNAGYERTTGCQNTSLGYVALYNNTTGNNNTGVGYYAGAGITSGCLNTVVGYLSARYLSSGVLNVAIGTQHNTTCTSTGSCNVFVGNNLYTCATSAASNIVVGNNIGVSCTITGANNIIIGNEAFKTATTAACSIGIGPYTLQNITTGMYNIGVGMCALGTGITTGCLNIGIGYAALAATTSGYFNSAVGYGAGRGLTTGYSNSIVGVSAFCAATSACFNTVIGPYAVDTGIATSNYNTIIGSYGARCMCSGDANTTVGYGAASAGSISGDGNTAIGYYSICGLTTGCYNTAVGTSSNKLTTTGLYNTSIGNDAALCMTTACYNTVVGASAMGGANAKTGCYNVVVGAYSVSAISSGNYNNILGAGSGQALTTGSNNVIAGTNTGNALTCGCLNVFVGNCAGIASTTGCLNTVVGSLSAICIMTGISNTVVGACSARCTTSGACNTVVGSFAAFNLTTGHNNVFIGHGSAYGGIISGGCNVSSGYLSMYSVTTGCSNTAIGSHSLYSANTGCENTAVGMCALYAVTTGLRNTAVGYGALKAITTGCDLVAVGYGALCSNTTGTNNVAYGFNSLVSNQSGCQNIAFGSCALCSNISGNQSIAIGIASLLCSTGGINIAIGTFASYKNTTGQENIAIGDSSIFGNCTGGRNIAIGYNAMQCDGNKCSNIAIGTGEMRYLTTGGYNISISTYSTDLLTTACNIIAIGSAYREGATDCSYAVPNTSHKIYLGNMCHSHIYSKPTSITGMSDIRTKCCVSTVMNGIDILRELNPVCYMFKGAHDQKLSLGFVAQDIAKVLPTSIYDLTSDNNGYLGLRYTDIIAPTVSAVKTLDKCILCQQEEIAVSKACINLMNQCIMGLADRLSLLEKLIKER